jgi:hypothetical protein
MAPQCSARSTPGIVLEQAGQSIAACKPFARANAREAALRFRIDHGAVAEMLEHSAPLGYRRKAEP